MKSNFYLLFLSLCIVSCSNNDESGPCNDVEYGTKELQLYGCHNITLKDNIQLINDYIIVESQDEFNALSKNCDAIIPFYQQDMIVGRYEITKTVTDINYKLIKDCETNDWRLTVTMLQNDTPANWPKITFTRVLPKLGADENITVDVIAQ